VPRQYAKDSKGVETAKLLLSELNEAGTIASSSDQQEDLEAEPTTYTGSSGEKCGQ
jgi:hypothetical protein